MIQKALNPIIRAKEKLTFPLFNTDSSLEKKKSLSENTDFYIYQNIMGKFNSSEVLNKLDISIYKIPLVYKFWVSVYVFLQTGTEKNIIWYLYYLFKPTSNSPLNSISCGQDFFLYFFFFYFPFYLFNYPTIYILFSFCSLAMF